MSDIVVSPILETLKGKTVAYTMLVESCTPRKWAVVFTDQTVLAWNEKSGTFVNEEAVDQ